MNEPDAQKALFNIDQELKALQGNKKASQQMVDTRFATIFEEIADLIEYQGEALFEKN